MGQEPGSPRLKSLARRAATKAKSLKRLLRTVLDTWHRQGCRHPHTDTLTSLHAVFGRILEHFSTCTPLQAAKAAHELEQHRLGIVAQGAECLNARMPTDHAGIMVSYSGKYNDLSCGLLRLLHTILREETQPSTP